MKIIGIDENGLGPLLGPLVVTAAVFEATSYQIQDFWQLAGADLPADDSKVLFSRQSPKSGEKAILSWLSLFGIQASTHAELAKQLLSPLPLAMPCPKNGVDCGKPKSRLPIPNWLPHPVDHVSPRILDRFKQANIKPYRVTAFSACPGALNKATEKPDGINKFNLDFELMLQLIKNISQNYTEDTLALCGKVGSTKNYKPWLDESIAVPFETIEETREVSTYIINKKVTVSLIKDGDALHLPISVASIVGKYVREFQMMEINHLFEKFEKEEISGYRDKRTKAFVSQTLSRREEIGLPDSCFLRNC